MEASLIVAVTENKVVGDSKASGLLWSIKDDLKLFKSLTANKMMVVGHKTYKQLPIKMKIADKTREYAIISRKPIRVNIFDSKSISCSSLPFLMKAKFSKDLIIIGGKQIYEEALTNCEELIKVIYVTRIKDHGSIQGDLTLDIDKWLVNYSLEEVSQYPKSERNQFAFEAQVWKRRP